MGNLARVVTRDAEAPCQEADVVACEVLQELAACTGVERGVLVTAGAQQPRYGGVVDRRWP